MGLVRANNVISERIEDGTIQEADIQNVLKATLKLPDGQLLEAEIIFREPGEGVNGDVLGLTTGDGFWRVLSLSDGLAVNPPLGGIGGNLIANNAITNNHIQNNAIGANHIGPDFLSSVDGVANDGGNVDFIPGDNITITPNNLGNTVTFALDPLGLDADTLDGLDSTAFLLISGGTITGSLTINNDLTVLGESFHLGEENFYGGINLESSIYNKVGTVLIADDAEIIGHLDINGDLTVFGDSFHWGDESFYGFIDAQGTIFNTIGDLVLDDDVNVTGHTFLDEDVYLGDSIGDTLYANGRFGTGLIPDTNDIYSLGASLLRWRNGLFSNRVRVGAPGLQTNLRPNGLRTVGQNMRLVTDSYDIVLRPGTNLVRSNATIRPTLNKTYDLGTATFRWDDIFADDLNLMSDLTVMGDSDLQGRVFNSTGALLLDDRVNVTGRFDPQGIIKSSTGPVVVDDRLNVTGRFDPQDIIKSSTGAVVVDDRLNVLGRLDPQDVIKSSTGDVVVDDDLTVTGSADIDTELNVDGATTLNGTVDLGDATGDTVTFNGYVGSSIIPDTTNAYDLGTGVLRWRRGYFRQDLRVGIGGLQIRYEDDRVISIGQDLTLIGDGANKVVVDDDLEVGDFGGSPIFSVNNSTANGPEAGPVATVYEVTVDGDLEVTGTIDPTAILLEPLSDGDTAIQVNDTAGPAAFTVDENGEVYAKGDINTDGELTAENATVNAQLTVLDLSVTGNADFNNVTSIFKPGTDQTYNLGTSGRRWKTIFGRHLNVNRDLTVGRDSFLGNGLGDTTTVIGTLTINGTNVETAMAANAAAITALDTRITALEALDKVIGGVEATCAGSATNVTVVTCTITPGVTFKSITVTPISTGTNVKISISAGSGLSTIVYIYGPAAGATISGASWVAVY